MENNKWVSVEEPRFKAIKKSVRFSGLLEWINKKGLDGWELYDTVTSYKGRTRTYYFRKPRVTDFRYVDNL